MPLTSTELGRRLWDAADILRGQIDSADYKNYILWLLAVKRLSDRFDEEVERAVGEGLDQATAESDPDEHEFFIPATCRWRTLVNETETLSDALNTASFEIEAANPKLQNILRATNWADETKLGTPKNREGLIRRLLTLFSGLNLRNDNLERADALGDAYEYLINRFADDAGKKGGEFYTPRPVVRLLAQLLAPQEGMRICDPTAGSGGMLIYSAEYVREHGGDPRNLTLHGQEKNLTTLGLGKLNLLLHGLPDARIEGGDTLRDPQLLDTRGGLLAYDRVIANPPFSLKDWGYEVAADDPHKRFTQFGPPQPKPKLKADDKPGMLDGTLPPRTTGDLAFLLHMLATTNAQGMVGVVMPHGVLFRGGSEAKIREGIVRADLFEAIIGLAPNLFFGASIPVAICILNKSKRPERRGKVLFVDAAQEGYYRAGKAQNFLEKEHVDKIVAAFECFEDVPRFAHVAGLEEIAANDFNLNISRYVDTTVVEERADVGAALARLRELERERDRAVAEMNRLLAELGYA